MPTTTGARQNIGDHDHLEMKGVPDDEQVETNEAAFQRGPKALAPVPRSRLRCAVVFAREESPHVMDRRVGLFPGGNVCVAAGQMGTSGRIRPWEHFGNIRRRSCEFRLRPERH